jgi:hypothetical protein
LKYATGERLKKVAEVLYKGNASELARKLEMKPQALRKYITGESMPGGLILIRLYNLGININWFLTGEGRMHVEEYPVHISEPIEQYLARLESDNLKEGEQEILNELLEFSHVIEELELSSQLKRALLLVYAKHVENEPADK